MQGAEIAISDRANLCFRPMGDRARRSAAAEATAEAAPSDSGSTSLLVLPLGDSITDGGAKQRSYRFHLHTLLAAAGHRVRWAGSMAGVSS